MSPSLAAVCVAGQVQEELGLGQLPAEGCISCPRGSGWAPRVDQGRRRLQRHRGQQQLPRLAAAVSVTASLLWLEISSHLQ